jgi:hypothetical protein
MGLIGSFCQRIYRSLSCCCIREKPENVSYIEIARYSWSNDDVNRVARIRERYPQLVGVKATCRVCLKICRIDVDFSGHQVRKLVNPRPIYNHKQNPRDFKGMLCLQCSKIQKDKAARKELSLKESAFIQDPFMRALYDTNRGLTVDLNDYGIYSKADYD